jgi:hypothetical protein
MLLLLRIMNVYQWISPTNGKVLPGPRLYHQSAGRGEVMLCLVSFFPRVFKRGKQGNPVYMEVLMGKIIYQCWIFQQAMFDDTRKYPTLIPWLVHSYPITIPILNIIKPYESRHYFRDTFSHENLHGLEDFPSSTSSHRPFRQSFRTRRSKAQLSPKRISSFTVSTSPVATMLPGTKRERTATSPTHEGNIHIMCIYI